MHRPSVVALLLTLSCLALLLSVQVHAELTFVIEQTRHGARYPVVQNSAEKELYDIRRRLLAEEIFAVQEDPELSATGLRQLEVLGQTLRKEYIDELHFLPPKYNYTTFYAISTDVNRTLLSANAQLYGLYPPGTGQQLPKNLSHQYTLPPYTGVQYKEIGLAALPGSFEPIPVHSNQATDDPQLVPFYQCSNFVQQVIVYLAQQKKWLADFQTRLQPTVQAAQIILARPDLKFSDLSAIYDQSLCDVYNAVPLPNNLDPTLYSKSQLWKNITYIAQVQFYGPTQSQQIRNLINNALFRQWIKYLDAAVAAKTKGKSNGGLKWVLYSAHDINLDYILPALNFTSLTCLTEIYEKGSTDALNCVGLPPFAANLIVELHDADTIKIKYEGVYMNLCERKSTECSYNEWRSRVYAQTYSEAKYDTLCGNSVQAGVLKKTQDEDNEVTSSGSEEEVEDIDVAQMKLMKAMDDTLILSDFQTLRENGFSQALSTTDSILIAQGIAVCALAVTLFVLKKKK